MKNDNVFINRYSLDEWIKEKRTKTLESFLENEYGFFDPSFEKSLDYKVVKYKKNNDLIIEKVEMRYSNHPMYFYIYLPNKEVTNLKTFITIVHPMRDKGELLIDDYESISDFCPIDDIISNGFALVLLSCNSVAEDRIGGENSGIFKEMNISRSKYSCGILGAWAWACSKVIDYLVLRKEFDETKIAVVGHSRGGKTALLAASLDERIFLAISNCSGNSGAALSRNSNGEKIKDIVSRFPYWFNLNYQNYVDNEDNLPFDQHQLLGLIAPRYCYIASASEDYWADPEGELKSCIFASQYYELYNVDGYTGPKCIENDVLYGDGHIAYRRKTGTHCLEKQDWINFIRYFNYISK